MIGKLAAGCGLALACSQAVRPAQWWHMAEIGTRPDRIEQFIDRSSIGTNAAGHKIISTATILERSVDSGIAAVRGVYEIDCRKGRARSIGRVGLGADGMAVSGVPREPLAWEQPRPDSFAALVSHAVCRGTMPEDALEIGDADPQIVSRIFFGQPSADAESSR